MTSLGAIYDDYNPYLYPIRDDVGGNDKFLASRSGHGGGLDCCPLVVDPFLLITILGAIAAATFFLNVLITMNITRRKKRNVGGLLDPFFLGKLKIYIHNCIIEIVPSGQQSSIDPIQLMNV